MNTDKYMNIDQVILYFCLGLPPLLYVLENIGFLFRIAGLKCGNLVAGYTFQNSGSYGSRFINLLFAPLFAYLADTKKIQINYLNISSYYFLLAALLSICIINKKRLIHLLSEIICYQQKGNSFIKSMLRKQNFIEIIKIFCFFDFFKIVNSFKVESFNFDLQIKKKVNKTSLWFMVTYIFYYGTWISIALLITAFPSMPAILISFSTYFTLCNSLYLSLVFDPIISRYSKDENITTYAYINLQRYKLLACILSYLMISIIYFLLMIYKLI